jgi:hypothetical protein
LFIRGGKQCTIVFLGQCLPVKVKGAGLSGLAGAFTAAMLMYHHAPQGFYTLGNPHGVLDRENQFARLGGGLIAYAVVGRFHRGRLIIGRLLGSEA